MIEGLSRDRGVPAPASHARDRQRADHHADGARRGGGPRPRARDRRRRLCHQALLPARAGRPRRRGAAPRAPGAGRRGADLCADIEMDTVGHKVRRAAAKSCRSGRPNSVCSRHFLEHPGWRVLARAAARCGVGPRFGHRDRAPSTSISAACARRSTTATARTSSARSARPATADSGNQARPLFARRRRISPFPSPPEQVRGDG